MTARDIRKTFLRFFEERGHVIVPSAPITNRQDPTLMFTNAGMNQFKDFFLGHQEPTHPRIADTQKCLRVSGKHNDLEEVGVDSYHHTMFEMLGNWSFGDYFKEEAIQWAWELLTREYGLSRDRLYVTIFEGDASEGLEEDTDAVRLWAKWIPEDRILRGNKKDNFWEMGDTGPCGPCSEIHVDLRSEAERARVDARELVNNDHPQVVEIWNLVFIQYNRKADGSLEALPAKHVDTGMGFERLVMALQGKQSNYDTDVFSPLLNKIAEIAGLPYTNRYGHDAPRSDMAMRVIADHVRAVSFAIADGELPSSNGAGYVIRRILRRAVRYAYSFLHIKEPAIYRLVPILAGQMAEVFPELAAQEAFVSRVILEEERSFLRTLEGGLKRLDQVEIHNGILDGDIAFELYDTYGFPIDLTRLIAHEKGFAVDEPGFEQALEAQKARSRAASVKTTGDWEAVMAGTPDISFLGYDQLEVEDARIVKYRSVSNRQGNFFQIVLDRTPFYPEGGGQVGDTGFLSTADGIIRVEDTVRENDLIIHVARQMPEDPSLPLRAVVDESRRRLTENNHSATHLLHAALRQVLGDHVQQKGSMLNDQYLRFDFSHFQKVSETEIQRIEQIVNQKIRANIHRDEARRLPIEDAKAAGAMMLFGEKYGDHVRMITFDPGYSRELCGGCHVPETGRIGLFKITTETAVAAGVRRIEAITAEAAESYVHRLESDVHQSRNLLKAQGSISESVQQLLDENKSLRKQLEVMQEQQAMGLKTGLKQQAVERDGIRYLVAHLPVEDPKSVKNLIFQLEQELSPAVIVTGNIQQDKPMLSVIISKEIAEAGTWNAGQLIREWAKPIQGGGGGQPFYATAGGKNPQGLDQALDLARQQLGLQA
ncbi:MAG: alanine--tRNA ligase [Lewinellaceae bacterium]|nr:alanine--tRNA ligase [Lewinellaceae bacterium]